jgi:DNA-binding NarL/FixJ family response regulator
MFRGLVLARRLIWVIRSFEGAAKIANSFTARAVATIFRDSVVSDNTQRQRVPSRRAKGERKVMSNPITGAHTVVLADDHQMLREGLRRLLASEFDIEVVAEAGTGNEVLEALRRHPVDVVVLDLSMPGVPGMDLIKRIRADFPSVRVLVLTMHTSDQFAVRAFRSGASGFLTKEGAADQLVHAIRKIAAGGAYVPPELAERMAVGLNDLQDAPPHQQLSNREFEVYRHIMAGKRLTDIATDLHLSIKTISTHKAHIMEKLGVAGTASLVRYGLQHGLFEEHAAQAALLLEESDNGSSTQPPPVHP